MHCCSKSMRETDVHIAHRKVIAALYDYLKPGGRFYFLNMSLPTTQLLERPKVDQSHVLHECMD